MNKEQFTLEIENLKVYDAHTHLVGSKLCAEDWLYTTPVHLYKTNGETDV
jgi:hypothetical protein